MVEDYSQTQRAYEQLRADLIACRLEPGSRLNISRLQKSLGVSQAAVREALSRLVSEGLVTSERHSGFRAAPVAMSGYRELAQACATIEIPCLRMSIANGDLGWEGELLATYHIASKALDQVVAGTRDLESYTQHREAFHRKLFSACGNEWLIWAWSLLYAQHIRYRQTFRSLAQYERSLYEDYRAFIDAVIARDAETAVRIWTENHERIARFIETNLKSTEQQVA